MSRRTDSAQRTLALAVAAMRRRGLTYRDIAEVQAVDVKRVPKLIELGERLQLLDARAAKEGNHE